MNEVMINKIIEGELVEIVPEILEQGILKCLGFDNERIEEIISEKRKNRDFINLVTKDKLINKEIHMKRNYMIKELYVNIEDEKYLLNTVKIKSLKITYINGRIEVYDDINFEHHSEQDMQACINWDEPTVIAYLEEYGVKCTLNVCKLIELGCKVELIDYDM